MNELLIALGLLVSLIGFAGLIKPLEVLDQMRWIGCGLIVLGSCLAVFAGTRSDNGTEINKAIVRGYMEEILNQSNWN